MTLPKENERATPREPVEEPQLDEMDTYVRRAYVRLRLAIPQMLREETWQEVVKILTEEMDNLAGDMY